MGDFLRFLANFYNLLCFCILFFSCCSNKYHIYGARELADPHQHAMEVNSLKPASTCSSSTKGLQIAHIYGPCSPLGQETPRPTTRQILLHDQSRVRSLSSTSSNGFSIDDFGLGTKLSLQKSPIAEGNYVITVGFGTPKRDLTLMFDTGSDITWIQCQPCISCYNQADEPIFDPSKSSTFSNASCISTCEHTESYHDQSYSSGYFARETLTISSHVFPDFVFLCGQKNSKTWGQVAGVLGMGLSNTSLMSQTLTSFWQTYCYCLPSTETSTAGFLVLGDEAYLACQPGISITLGSDPAGLNSYFVSLVGITIGHKRLQVSSDITGSSSQNAILDSGTVISRLPTALYSELCSSFKELMSQYTLAKALDHLMDTCYNLEGYDIDSIIPDMILHFDNSDLKLDPSSVVWREDDSRFCLAFAADNVTEIIIGNYQQRNRKIYYDIIGKVVGFSTSGGC